MKIGVVRGTLGADFVSTVKLMATANVEGIQPYANIYRDVEDLNAQLTPSKIAEYKRILEGENIQISALCGDLGCDMFYTNDRKIIDLEKRIMEVAKEFGTKIVTTHIGVVPEDKNCKQYESMHNVCYELAKFADEIGGRFALETGPEKASLLKEFLDGLDSRGVSVNLDPANLVMCAGDDPVQAVYTLKDYIVHTHAKDGKQLVPVDTRRLYAPQYYGVEPAAFEDYIIELPLGEGNVDWVRYLKALKDIGYDGYLTIEREYGADPVKDIKMAVGFLKEKLEKI